jgi:hypothetical protein
VVLNLFSLVKSHKFNEVRSQREEGRSMILLLPPNFFLLVQIPKFKKVLREKWEAEVQRGKTKPLSPCLHSQKSHLDHKANNLINREYTQASSVN